jgi:hypothetical protein
MTVEVGTETILEDVDTPEQYERLKNRKGPGGSS